MKSEETIGTKYRVSVEWLTGSYGLSTKKRKFEAEEFETIKEAKKFIREMMKKYNMTRHAGHIVNYKDRYELFTNF
jgi:hypothetical protein